MMYSRWATMDELKNRLVQVNVNSKIEKSGIPMMYDDNNLYIDNGEGHNLIIGSTGSGKTQSILLPQARLAIKAEESLIIHDVKGEIYEKLIGELKKQNYNTIVINLYDPKFSNNFNPLTLPYELYKNNQKDKVIEVLENIGHYIFISETLNKNADPFWTNSAISCFIGLALYLFENAKEEEISFNSIFKLSTEIDKISDYVKKLDKANPIYLNLSSIVLAPSDTKGSIISVFTQMVKLFTIRESLSALMSTTNIDINSIQKEKTAIFIIAENKVYSRRLVPLIIDECYQAIILGKNHSRRVNILIDEFENLIPMKELTSILITSRRCNIRFTVFLKSFLELRNSYGKEEAEIVKISFNNIIYLLANDIETLEQISKYCGNQSANVPLITIEELKLLDKFEAVISVPREYPIRTKLLPDYQINWNFSEEKVEIKELENKEVKIFNFN